MTKILLFITILLVALLDTTSAANVRTRRDGGNGLQREKGAVTKGLKHRPKSSVRKLKFNKDPKGFVPPGYRAAAGKAGKSRKGLQCRPVVEGAEFIVQGAINNGTGNANSIGSEFIYNGPLLEFDNNDQLQEIPNFYLSGSCIRVQTKSGSMPGAGRCQYTITLDTGATMNFGGEVFDGFDNIEAIDGGSQELIGLSGTVTLIALDSNYQATSADFFSAPWIYGEAVLVYSICPQGYWEPYYITDHSALPPPAIPNPFKNNAATQVPQQLYYSGTQVPQQLYYPGTQVPVGDDGAYVGRNYFGN